MSLVFLGIFFAAGRPAVLFSLCFPSVACVCLFFFYFFAIFSCFLPSGRGVGFLWRGVQKCFFFVFFSRFFFWCGALSKGFFCFFFRVFWGSVK